MLDEGVREKVQVSPVGLQARPRSLVRFVEEVSHLRVPRGGASVVVGYTGERPGRTLARLVAHYIYLLLHRQINTLWEDTNGLPVM